MADGSVEAFLDFLTNDQGASSHTVSAYQNDISQFVAFCEGKIRLTSNKFQWRRITRKLIVDFLAAARAKGSSEATVSRRLSSLRSFFVYLRAEGMIPTNPASSIPSIHVEKLSPRTMTPEQIDALLQVPKQSDRLLAKRDYALMELLYATGLRTSELAALTVDDISLLPGNAYVHCVGRKSVERLIPINERVADVLRDYLNGPRKQIIGENETDVLFPNWHGERMTRAAVWYIFKPYAQKAGFNNISPQTLRQSFATHMLQGGVSVQDVQKYLGHADLSTTQFYTNCVPREVSLARERYDAAHPRAF